MNFDAVHAVCTLSVFLAAGSRIAPAYLRIQTSVYTIRVARGSANQTLDFIHELMINNHPKENLVVKDNLRDLEFQGTIKVSNLNFEFQNKRDFTIDIDEIEICEGEFVAFVGPSGSGKSTLVDLILGALTPKFGNISISGISNVEALKIWPGKVAYVPQNVIVFPGTIRQNIALGFDCEFDSFENSQMYDLLNRVNLGDFLDELVLGLDTEIGERGTGLSGGQKQRLGIARALFTNPQILVLDEATSALDSETEAFLSNTLYKMKGSITLISIAHRLSTIKNADKIFYINDGKILASGKFEELRLKVPNFDSQAKLMGIN